MIRKTRFISRLKAAVVGAAMIATTFISPALTTFSSVSAASVNVNKTFTTTDDTSESATNKAKIPLSGIGNASTITLNFTTSYSGNATIGIYGWEITEDPWWADDKQEAKPTISGGKCSVTFNVPAAAKGKVKTVGVGVWYPKDGTTFTLTSIDTDGSVGPTPSGDKDIPVSKNPINGCTFVDNKDGTATISSTLTAEVQDPDQTMDYLLTLGYDEDYYDHTLNPDAPEYIEGESPINAHKFKFSEFGIDDITNVKFQSFNYTIKSDVDLNQFMYGGGINVRQGSPSDTEYVKGKNGYWYNDQGEEDVKEFGDLFEISDYGTGYTATNAGQYVEVVWDVPKSVQEDITKGESDTVGFQYWYGANGEDEETYEPIKIETVHLTAASCTYTRTMTVPYNKTITKSTNKTLTAGSDTTNQIKYPISDLNLGERDKLSAIKFTVTSTSDLHKLTTGVGISVDAANAMAEDGWYQPSNMIVLDGGKTAEIMWILPEAIRDDVYNDEAGEVLFGFWYGNDTKGTEVKNVTLKSVDYYTYVSQEDELTVDPAELEIEVDETKQLKVNVDGCTFISTNKNVATVDSKGNVVGIAAGTSTIVVTTPEKQEFIVNVIVKKPVVTTVVSTTPSITTVTTVTTTVVTTPDPDSIIDWDRVLYGDVNVDKSVNSTDVVVLNKYLLSDEAYALKNATAKENANCVYDEELNSKDSMAIINYVLELSDLNDLGPINKPQNEFYK